MTKWLCLLGIALLPHPLWAADFDLQSKGQVVWVADGDSFYFKPQNALMWVKLRQRARQRQASTGRALRIAERFNREDMTFLVRVGNVNTAESAPAGRGKSTAAGRRAEAFAKQLLSGTKGTLYCWEIGYYGRPICSFWTQEWEYGQRLIAAGHSPYVTRFGRHPRWHKAYLKAQSVAD
jgi:endonuclease YncB( thermonuclease family)